MDIGSLKPTVTRGTPFAKQAKPVPHYGGLVPPFCVPKRSRQNMRGLFLVYIIVSKNANECNAAMTFASLNKIIDNGIYNDYLNSPAGMKSGRYKLW
jgi:hypothetical protein